MSDLISREQAINRINKQREHLQPNVYPQDAIGDSAYRICAEFIERLPSAEQHKLNVAEYIKDNFADVWEHAEKELEVPSAEPKIIRCKDCKHYQFADNRAFGMPVKMCEWFGFEDVDDDDYCSRAERRKEE